MRRNAKEEVVRSVRPSASVESLTEGSMETTFDSGHQPMSRAARASRMPAEASGEMGIGVDIGLITLMLLDERRPRRSR